jgi:hypothetical protein
MTSLLNGKKNKDLKLEAFVELLLAFDRLVL